MPLPGTEFTPLFEHFLAWSILVSALVALWGLYALIRYRHRRGDPRPRDHPKAGYFPHHRGSSRVEAIWTIGPTMLIVWLAWVSLAPLDVIWAGPPADSPDVQEVRVEGSQWVWEFTYENGTTAFNDVVVRCGVPVRFTITSTDVLHSLYIPDYGIKEDAVPGLETTMWLDPTSSGTYTIQCAEYCGRVHARMLGSLIIEGPCPG